MGVIFIAGDGRMDGYLEPTGQPSSLALLVLGALLVLASFHGCGSQTALALLRFLGKARQGKHPENKRDSFNFPVEIFLPSGRWLRKKKQEMKDGESNNGVTGMAMENEGNSDAGSVEGEYIRRHHRHDPADHQCSSTLIKHIRAPLPLVWSLVRRFDQPQKYKPFISRCVAEGNLEIGSLREIDVKSGLPATTSTERLELLDDDKHILSMRIIGGDHRLKNYSSIVSLHPEITDGRPGTLVIESFVVDIPDGNTKDETCYFVEALINCNLKSLADVSERLAVQDRTEPIDLI